MPTIDISNLTGNDLFNALKSGIKIVKSQKKITRKPDLATGWVSIELVLIIHQMDCKTCGAQYQFPNSTVLLHQHHPRKGEHYLSISPVHKDPEKDFAHLVLVEQIERDEVAVCQRCWNIQHIIETALEVARAEPKTTINLLPKDEAPIVSVPDEFDNLPDPKSTTYL